MPDVNEMSIEELRALPRLQPHQRGEVNAIVVLPREADELHSTGYRMMEFVACTKGGEPLGNVSGCSDVLHIEGIGGWGFKWLERYGTCPEFVLPTGWSIDCLAKSGLLRFWPSFDHCDGIILDDTAVSSYCIWGHIRPDRDPRKKKVDANDH